MTEALIPTIDEGQAKLLVTYGGQQGDFRDPVPFDATDAQIKTWITEAVRAGGIIGIDVQPTANFEDFVIDRFNRNETRPTNVLVARPKTPFGGTK
jgi:hypothetical protein